MKEILKNLNHDHFIILSEFVFVIAFFLQSTFLAILSLSILFGTLIIEAIKDFKNKSLLFFFLIAFFTFTMGQYFIENINTQMYYLNFPTHTIIKTIFIQYLALMSIYLAIKVVDHFANKKCQNVTNEIKNNSDNTNFKIINQIIFCFLFISFVISIVTSVESAIRVMKYGYLEIYVNNHPSIFPEYIFSIGNSLIIFTSLYLSMSSSKKKSLIVLGMYFFSLCASLFSGSRSTFVIGIMYIIFYLIIMQKNYKWFKLETIKKFLITIVAITPIAIVGLNIYNNTRNTIKVEDLSISKEFRSFFLNQGGSINLVSYSQEFKQQINSKDHNYVLGPVIEVFNKRIQDITNNKVSLYDNTKLENQRKYNFAIDMSIYILGEDMYAKGNGTGSQYLAELYIEYGYFGVVLFNFMLGIIIYCLNKLCYKKWFFLALTLILFPSIVYIARGQTMQILLSCLSITFWGSTLLIFLLNKFIIFLKKKGVVDDESSLVK